MPQVLTTNAQIRCTHLAPGRVPAPSTPWWSVAGGTVLVEGDTGVITGCPLGSAPCLGFTLRSMGFNASVMGGRRVILVTDFQQSNTMLPLLLSETHSTIDDTTPAPIIPAQAPPPLSPELLDVVPPIVGCTPPTAGFTRSTQTPPLVVFVFSINTAFPGEWRFTHIGPTGGAQDLTGGGVPGPLVAPSGGAWPVPALTITVRLDTPYLNSLATGIHHFYMSAVSKRGIPATFDARLTVA